MIATVVILVSSDIYIREIKDKKTNIFFLEIPDSSLI